MPKLPNGSFRFADPLFVVAGLIASTSASGNCRWLATSASACIYVRRRHALHIGYLLFEIQAICLAEDQGSKTIARITILWGLTSIATMFVKTATGFYILRFLLGAFEAGLYPGVILYLTYWFPSRRRGRMMGAFMTAVPIAGILGGPISGWIMASMGGRSDLANWQWLFLLEGLPSIAMGLLTLEIFVDKPAQASWLSDHEKQLIVADLEAVTPSSRPR